MITIIQNIPKELLFYAVIRKRETILRDYLVFRAYALNNGSFYKKPDEVSWGNLKKLKSLGWIEKVNTNHYRVVSIYKITLQLGLNISIKTKIETKEAFKSSGSWGAYLSAKTEGYALCRKKVSERKKNREFDRDGVKKKGNVNQDNTAILSTRWMQAMTGRSHSTISSRRKYGFNKYERQFCEDFDNLRLKRKSDVAHYVEMVNCSDLSDKEKEARKNIFFCKKLKQYRLVTSTKVIFYNPYIISYSYNRSASTYRKRYAKVGISPSKVVQI